MATPLLLGRNGPRCLSCLRKSLRAESYDPISSFQLQLRGKKRQAKIVHARLMRDVATWGRKGSIINVAPGRMRNIWMPRGYAQYVTADQIKATGEQPVERDLGYGVRPSQAVADEVDDGFAERELDIQVPLLQPRQAASIIDNIIPPTLQFFRKPILGLTNDKTPSPPPSHDPAISSVRGTLSPEILAAASQDAQKAIAAHTAAAEPTKPVAPIAIYGSVTTADITTSIKAVLAAAASENDDEAARVVLSAEDVFIVHEAEATGETDRIKALGEYVVEIRLPDAPVVTRTVTVEAAGGKPRGEDQ